MRVQCELVVVDTEHNFEACGFEPQTQATSTAEQVGSQWSLTPLNKSPQFVCFRDGLVMRRQLHDLTALQPTPYVRPEELL